MCPFTGEKTEAHRVHEGSQSLREPVAELGFGSKIA